MDGMKRLTAQGTATGGRVGRNWGIAMLAMATLISPLVLTSCASTTPASSNSAGTTTRAAQLALGTIALEGTDQAVDANSAAQLLPLWELYADVSTSSTAAPAEVTAVVEAIGAAMTSDQLKAIAAMDLAQADAGESPAGAGAAPVQAAAASDATSAIAMSPELGGDMGAGMPMDGGMPSGGEMPTGPSSSQPAAAGLTKAGVSPSGVFQQVIALLRGKTQS